MFYTRLYQFVLLLLFVIGLSSAAISQSCNLDLEDFTGSSTNNPPAGWEMSGIFIGQSVPPDPMQDPAANVNRKDEYMISPTYTCLGEICFDWHASSAGSNYDVEVAYSQDGSNWTLLTTIVTNGSNSPTTYQQVCLTIPSGALQPPYNVQVRWLMTRRSGGTFYAENICFTDQSCGTPSAPVALSFFDDMLCDQINTPINMEVCAVDTNGQVATTYTGSVSLSLVSGPGNMSGSTTYSMVDGCADLNATQFDQPGDYVLAASSDTLNGISSPIDIVAACPTDVDIRVMFYNLLNFSDGQSSCGGTTVQNRWDTLEKIVHHIIPDVLMVCELENEGGADIILSNSLNSNGYSNYARANFVLDQSGGSSNLNNMFFYNSNKMTLYAQTEIMTTTRDIGKYTVFINDPNLAQTQDTVFIDFYVGHLKAGPDASDMAKRQTDCTMLKSHIDAQPDRNFVLAGDLNLYTSSEAAYQTLLGGTHPLNDPINTPGNWNTNSTFAHTHTQSTRTSTSLDCGSTGGLDSRFDFILINDAIKNETMDVSYVANSYIPFGNGGNTYNDNINDPWNNSGVPASILDALFYMSDHIPVVMDLSVTLSAPACPVDLVIDAPMIATGFYGADSTIVARGTVVSGDSVVFSAGKSITLDTSFSVDAGGVLEVGNSGCGN